MATTVLDFSTPHVLRNAKEYRAAVAEIDALLDADPKRGTSEYDRLEFLSVLVEAYEDAHDPIDERGLTPQDIVNFMLEQRGMTRAELYNLMGGESRVSEFFAGKRRLSAAREAHQHDAVRIDAGMLRKNLQ